MPANCDRARLAMEPSWRGRLRPGVKAWGYADPPWTMRLATYGRSRGFFPLAKHPVFKLIGEEIKSGLGRQSQGLGPEAEKQLRPAGP
jgi:hypothetical protein